MWKWTKTEYRLLSLFANFSKRSEVLNSFKNELPALDELRGKLDGCRQMVEAVYNVLAKREVRYSLEEYDSSQDSQWIRTPAEILDSKSQGTCLDLAVLFCGICLRYELIPLLIVSGNHAWVAVSLTHWLHECKASDRDGNKLFNEGLLTNKENVVELCNLVEHEEAYIAIECTGFTQGSLSKSFDQAEQEGLNRLRSFSSQNGSFILDIPIAHDFSWRDLCTNRLEAEPIKRLINSPLANGENPLRELYVPLGLIERKPDAQRRPMENASPPEGSSFNQPDDQYEVVRKYEHKEFFDEVLKQNSSSRSQGKRLAIVGDPGGGKTTLLQRIAYWVLEEEQGLPIWIPLGDVNENWVKGRDETDEGWLYRYLSENWLKNVAREPEKTPIELQQAFKELLKSGQVWLLLDGANEMAIKSPLMRIKKQLAKGWADSVRVVLNCRLNLWEVEKEALWETFDIYRTLDFSYPEQVHQFINNWFGEDNPEANELQAKLADENRKRLQDLVKNPLRLALLCRIWKRGLATLPETKADFYRLLVENYYKWKDDSTNEEFEIPEDRKKELNRALGQLARDAIERDDFRFRLRESSVRKYLKDPNEKFSLFGWALRLGWLLDVGFPTEGERNQGEKVYAFFHPTFQEYFAATGVDNYDFFLPMEHRDRPVKDKNNPEKYKRYRIFEPQWKEVILLWLGHQKEELRLQKVQFIQMLIKFDDGIKHKFYFYQALFLAAAGIVEFRDCPFLLVEEIVSAIVMISFGCLNDKEQEWLTFPKASAEEARKVLLETDRDRVIAVLETLITSVCNFLISNQPLTLCDLSLMLLRIEPKSSVAVNSLTQLRNIGKNWIHVLLMAWHYWSVQRGYTRKKIDKLFNAWDDKNRSISELIDELIGINEIVYNRQYQYLLPDEAVEIAVHGNTDEINALIHNFKNSSDSDFFNKYSPNTLYKVLSPKPANVNPIIEAFIEGLHSQNHTCRFLAITGLSIIGINNQAAIQALTEVVQKSKDSSDRTQAVCALGYIGIGNLGVFNTLLEVVRNEPDDWIRTQAVRGLAQVTQGNGFPIVVAQLKKYLQITSNRNTFNKDKSIFYRECYETTWHCAQNMTYPAFYQAWRTQPTFTKI